MRYYAAVLTLMVVLLLSACAPTQPETYEIGAILPLTGPAAITGEQLRDGILLAVQQINEDGGINGKPIQLHLQDSQTQPTAGVSAFMHTIQTTESQVIITALSSVSSSIAPLAPSAKIPIIATVAVAPNITNEYTFRYYTQAQAEAQTLIDLVERKHLNNIGIIYLKDDFGNGVVNAFEQSYKGTIHKEAYERTQTDMKSQIAKLQAQNVQAIVMIGFENHIQLIAKQLKENNNKAILLTPSTGATPSLRKAFDDIGVDVYIGAPAFYNPENQKAREVSRAFSLKYNKEMDHYAAVGYDTIYMIKQAAQAEESILDGLNNLQTFQSIFGQPIINKHELSFPLQSAMVSNYEIIINQS